jgi:hypothetical protein
MYSVLGNRLIKKGSLVGTFNKDEMIDYLLNELNEISEDYQSCEVVKSELEDALYEIDYLKEKLEEYE